MKNLTCICGGNCGMCEIVSLEDNSLPIPGGSGCSCSDDITVGNGMYTPPKNK